MITCLQNEICVSFFSSFQVHVMESSNIPDHCICHALSDDKEPTKFGTGTECDHKHDYVCLSCEELKTVLGDIKDAIADAEDHLTSVQHDDIRFTFQEAISAINAWKAHQLRSIQQDKARTDILRELGSNEVMITQDWAMKFLPQKYRETQSDWFGKRGISWHISVVVRKTTSGQLLHQVYVHIVANCSQESNAVIAIMEHTLRSMKDENPEIMKAYYRQDNAGCYHSAETLTACHLMESITGIKVNITDTSYSHFTVTTTINSNDNDDNNSYHMNTIKTITNNNNYANDKSWMYLFCRSGCQ